MQAILRTQNEIRKKIDFLIESDCQDRIQIEKLQDALHFSKLPYDKDDEIFLWLIKRDENNV